MSFDKPVRSCNNHLNHTFHQVWKFLRPSLQAILFPRFLAPDLFTIVVSLSLKGHINGIIQYISYFWLMYISIMLLKKTIHVIISTRNSSLFLIVREKMLLAIPMNSTVAHYQTISNCSHPTPSITPKPLTAHPEREKNRIWVLDS